jgi:hypothetical protein
MFRHKPLAHAQPSIRLVTIAPTLSSDGLIQCDVTHATIQEASYTCLSYRWGAPEPTQTILINGTPCLIRQNLFDFLQVACTIPEVAYWIDAICIDQTNTDERNHQVAQMGKIFSNATQVHLWLGVMPASLLPLLHIIQKAKASTYDDWGAVRSNTDTITKYIIDNEYWTRAWITQEIMLAREVIVVMGTMSMGFAAMLEGMEYFYLINGVAQSQFSQISRQFREELQLESLISLLAHFRDKRCDDPRDRVFSLLSLCTKQGRDLEVNYDSSVTEIAVQVLRECNDELCICSAATVAHALGLHSHGNFLRNSEIPYLELDVTFEPPTPVATSEDGYEISEHSILPDCSLLDTCESSILAGVCTSWDDTHTYPLKLSFGSPDHTLPGVTNSLVTFSTALYVNGVALQKISWHLLKTTTNRCTIRLALSKLARMVNHSVQLCLHTKQTRTRRRHVPIGHPRICYILDDVTVDNRSMPPVEPNLAPSLQDINNSILDPKPKPNKKQIPG